MDRSIDSIGSCSLDVDADSTDFSDTSGSLNITPSSAKDITREFTANFKERCRLNPGLQGINNYQQTTTILDKSGNITTILTTPPINTTTTIKANTEKKPSYLNLACCVNGYSNLTTYDSKLRQNINKSREVSPIRPSENTLQYCKNYKNFLSPPFYVFIGRPDPSMETKHEIITQQNKKMSNTTSITKLTKTTHCIGDFDTVDKSTTLVDTQKSFIQQRVERLYGIGAIEQGVYSPKKNIKTPPKIYKNSSDSDKFDNKTTITTTINGHNGVVDLPVLRHLRPEFRAQLPIVSPKKIKSDLNTDEIVTVTTDTNETINNIILNTLDNDNNDINKIQNGNKLELKNMTEAIKSVDDNNSDNNKCENGIIENGIEVVIDAKYFIKLLKTEQIRLLDLAANVEKDMESLEDNPEISEEILGYLRSASGKARLLVSQKMKQFEGLCNDNMKQKAGEKFTTTVEDLQGFWDMVNLQVDHIDALFKEIEALKKSDWKNVNEHMLSNSSSTVGPHSQKKFNNMKSSTIKSLESNGATTNKNLTPAALAANQKREAQRKKLLEFKRKNKMAIAAAQGEKDNSENVLFLNGNSS